MYIAMNRFKIIRGKEELFEEIWKNRESDLSNIKGFLEFHLIKGSKNDEYTLMHLTVSGHQKKVLLNGLNLNLSGILIKMLINIKEFILDTQISKDSQ